MTTTANLRASNRDGFVYDAWATLLQEALEPALVITLITYWLWQCWLSASVQPPRYLQAMIMTLHVLLVFGLSWATRKALPRASMLIWIIGLYLGALIGAILYRSAWPYFVVPMVSLVSSLLLQRRIALAGAVFSLLLLSVGRSFAVPLTWTEIVGFGGFSVVAVALGLTMHGAIQTVVDWSFTSYRQAIKEMVEARERRAELVKVVKELDTAYQRLARLNSSLIEAWQRASDAEQRRTELVTRISHELRTPLNLILGFSEMIATSPESYGGQLLPPVYRSDFNAIYRNSLHLLRLLDDVLDLAKADIGKLSLRIEAADLTSVLNECVLMLDEYVRAKGLVLNHSVAADLPRVPMDRLRVRQVLLNLMTNAQAVEDVGIMRSLPEMAVVDPADDLEMAQAVRAIVAYPRPVYLRATRDAWPRVSPDRYMFALGRAARVREGGDVTLIGSGMMASQCLEAACTLSASRVEARVLNVATLKPIDVEAIVQAARETGAIVTAENHNVYGGLGSAVAEVLAEHAPAPMLRVGIRDCYGECGTNEELLRKYHMSPAHIVEAACQVLERKGHRRL